MAKKLYIAADLPQAWLLIGLLQQAGIDIDLRNENAQGALGELPFTHTWPELWLKDDQQWSQARAIVEHFERTTAEKEREADRLCANCGENNPPNFEYCWHCGAALVKDANVD